MTTIKDSLQQLIEQLDEHEARQVLEYARKLRDNHGEYLLQKLANHPAITLPKKNRKLSSGKPIQGKGIPASELLIKERR